MSNVRTSAGTRIYIALPMSGAYTVDNFEQQDWNEIGEVTDLGQFGKEFALVTHNPLGDRRTVKRKGSYNDGTIQLQYALDSQDEGQEMLRDAVDSDDSYAFRVVIQDGSVFYFSAQAMSSPISVGTVDQITSGSTALEIDNDILESDSVGTPPGGGEGGEGGEG